MVAINENLQINWTSSFQLIGVQHGFIRLWWSGLKLDWNSTRILSQLRFIKFDTFFIKLFLLDRLIWRCLIHVLILETPQLIKGASSLPRDRFTLHYRSIGICRNIKDIFSRYTRIAFYLNIVCWHNRDGLWLTVTTP